MEINTKLEMLSNQNITLFVFSLFVLRFDSIVSLFLFLKQKVQLHNNRKEKFNNFHENNFKKTHLHKPIYTQTRVHISETNFIIFCWWCHVWCQILEHWIGSFVVFFCLVLSGVLLSERFYCHFDVIWFESFEFWKLECMSLLKDD